MCILFFLQSRKYDYFYVFIILFTVNICTFIYKFHTALHFNLKMVIFLTLSLFILAVMNHNTKQAKDFVKLCLLQIF